MSVLTGKRRSLASYGRRCAEWPGPFKQRLRQEDHGEIARDSIRLRKDGYSVRKR